MKYWTIITLIFTTACGQKINNSEARRLEQARALIKKIGFQQLPFSYDMAKLNLDSRHSVDRNSNDTLFFDDFNGTVGGVLPDTSDYFGFIYYKVGDSIYPFLVTVDKKGKIVDRQGIGIGNCNGLLTVDVDSCLDRVTINKELQIALLYKLRGSVQTKDSIPKTVKLCNQIIGSGRITKNGKIEITKGDLQMCE